MADRIAGADFASVSGISELEQRAPGSGEQFFGGGPVATSTLTQTVDLSAAASDIDAGTVPYKLSGDLGGFIIDPSAASVTVDFLDANGFKLGTGKIRPVTVLDRWFQTGLLERETSGTIPVGTRSARVVVTFTDCNPVLGNYNNAYADNLSFTVGAALPAPPPPTPPVSTVGQLDHVFMVYLENKGFTDIVGSPNAPYLNSLINTYGFAIELLRADPPQRPELLSDPRRIRLRHQLQLPLELLRPAQPGRQHRGSGQDMGRLRGGWGRLQHPHRPITVPCLQRHL